MTLDATNSTPSFPASTHSQSPNCFRQPAKPAHFVAFARTPYNSFCFSWAFYDNLHAPKSSCLQKSRSPQTNPSWNLHCHCWLLSFEWYELVVEWEELVLRPFHRKRQFLSTFFLKSRLYAISDRRSILWPLSVFRYSGQSLPCRGSSLVEGPSRQFFVAFCQISFQSIPREWFRSPHSILSTFSC